MHYFKRNIGEYHKKAGRLTILQHGVYMLLMDACYDRERFPTKEEAIDWCWAQSDDEIAAVNFVLSKFFIFDDGIYTQNRILEEIEEYHGKALVNKNIAIERERRNKERREQTVHESSTNRAPVVHEPTPKQEPITKNQEPVNIKQEPNTSKDYSPKNKFSDADYKCAEWLAVKIQEYIPDYKKPNLGTWAGHIRKMRELDSRDLREICELWLWCRKDSFESSNVQSPEKLRSRYDQLKTKMRSNHGQPNPQAKPKIDNDSTDWIARVFGDSASGRSGEQDFSFIEGDFSSVGSGDQGSRWIESGESGVAEGAYRESDNQ